MNMKYALMGFAGLIILAACNQKNSGKSETNASSLPAKAVNVVTGSGVKASSITMAAAYFQLAGALVNWDTTGANQAAVFLAAAADSIDFTGTTDSALVKTIQDLAGGASVFMADPLNRRVADAQTMTAHIMTAPATYELTGRALLGVPVSSAEL